MIPVTFAELSSAPDFLAVLTAWAVDTEFTAVTVRVLGNVVVLVGVGAALGGAGKGQGM